MGAGVVWSMSSASGDEQMDDGDDAMNEWLGVYQLIDGGVDLSTS